MDKSIGQLQLLTAELDADACQRALNARDPRFDGLFFVGITTTGIYCRPVCPARVTHPERRRFFNSAAAAEHAGYRPCLRCRPELAPGRALCDSVSRLAHAAARRIAAGALNGRSVADLARELCVGERHLRRALERELGVSPVELAQTHRLLLAKQLLADTDLSVTRVAFASGFQSLRRFNAVFREQYRMSPTALRRSRRRASEANATSDFLRLTLAYRPPIAWDSLLAQLRRDATPGVEIVDGKCYGRTVRLDGHTGVVFAQDSAISIAPDVERRLHRARARNAFIRVDVSSSLVPMLMPLLARMRQLLDLDAEPSVIDAHLEQGGIGTLVRPEPGIRIPGALAGFDVALRTLVSSHGAGATHALASRIADAVGEPLDTGFRALTRLAPTAEQVANAGVSTLMSLGASRRRAEIITAVARQVADGTLWLEPGSDTELTWRALTEIGVSSALATVIVMRALYWPDAFPADDRALQFAAGVTSASALLECAESWRPWRAYAALHLWRHADDLKAARAQLREPPGHDRNRPALRPECAGAAIPPRP